MLNRTRCIIDLISYSRGVGEFEIATSRFASGERGDSAISFSLSLHRLPYDILAAVFIQTSQITGNAFEYLREFLFRIHF